MMIKIVSLIKNRFKRENNKKKYFIFNEARLRYIIN